MRTLETPPQEVQAAIDWIMMQPIKHTRIDGRSITGTLILVWTCVLNGQSVTILRTKNEFRYLETVSLVLKLRKQFLTGMRENVLIPHANNKTTNPADVLKRRGVSHSQGKPKTIAMVG